MKALTPVRLTYRAGLPAYLATPSYRSVSNHVGLPDHRLPPRQRDQRVSNFALSEQARRSTPAESSSFAYGPTVRLRLLSTPLRADAVTFSYGAVAYSGTDFHRADVAPLRAHSPPNVFIGGPVPNPPVVSPVEPPLKAYGNDGLRIGNVLNAASCGGIDLHRLKRQRRPARPNAPCSSSVNLRSSRPGLTTYGPAGHFTGGEVLRNIEQRN